MSRLSSPSNRHSWAIVFATSLVVACSGASDTPSDAVDSQAGLTSNSEPGDGAGYDVQRYDLKGELDWTRHRLVATVGITLQLPETRASAGPLVLDSAVTEIKAVRLAGGEPLHFAVDSENQTLTIDLPPNLRAVRIDVDYEAESASIPSGETFSMTPALKGDPTPVRAAFTFSEPFGARLWMPSHDEPSDRATFSVDMRMPNHEQLLANGNWISDEADTQGTHRTKYASGFTLPTYLMAFAVSDFRVETTHDHRLPVSVWHRRGIPNDDATVLSETVRSIDTLEKLIGPYPFDQYSQVFMPGPWGEENATITLISEDSLDYSSYTWSNQAAHELAHQWFGDLVSVGTFYDAWFKEGMATLLQIEASRIDLDQDHNGFYGSEGSTLRPVSDGDPIVRDRSLPPFPYNQGPYIRAQWLLNQVRSLLGEEAFWGTLRGVLHRYRYSTIDTDAFIAAFGPALGAETTAAMRRAVFANRIPRLHLEPSPSGGVFATLSDPDGSLITPMTVRWVAPDGSTRDQTLTLGARVLLAPERAGEFLVIDPRDVHPTIKIFASADGAESGQNYTKYVVPLLVPKGPSAIAQWLEIGAVHQSTLLRESSPALTPDAFESFMENLDSVAAKALAVQRGCETASAPSLDAPTRAAWSEVLSRVIGKPLPSRGVYAAQVNYRTCLQVVDVEKVFRDDWAKLATGFADGVSAQRVSYLSHFPGLSPARAFSIWSKVATNARSLDIRELAMSNLASYAEALDPADMGPWRAFFIQQLTANETENVLGGALYGVVATRGESAADNAAALAGLNAVLHDPNDYWYGEDHSDAVCAAYALIPSAPEAPEWQSFASGLSDANLKSDIRALVDDPSPCADGLPY